MISATSQSQGKVA